MLTNVSLVQALVLDQELLEWTMHIHDNYTANQSLEIELKSLAEHCEKKAKATKDEEAHLSKQLVKAMTKLETTKAELNRTKTKLAAHQARENNVRRKWVVDFLDIPKVERDSS